MGARGAASTAPLWALLLWQRARHLFWLKAIGTTAFTWLFFVAYFELLRHPTRPPTVMPLIALDRWITFQPHALFVYLTLWLYVGIAPGLQPTFAALVVHGLWAAALCSVGLACFYFWPTAVPPLGFDASSHAGFMLLQGVDAAGNACPSMHVAIALFSAAALDRLLRDVGAPAALRVGNVTWFALIVYSTVAIRQHVVLDAIAGAVLGCAFAIPALRWHPRKGYIPPTPSEGLDRIR